MTKLISSVTALAALTAVSCNKMAKPTQAEFSGKDIISSFEILRDKTTKAASLEVREDTKWELYGGPSVEEIDFSKPIASGEGTGTFDLDVPTATRSYFQLVTPEGNAILADKHLPMEGGYNYRDMGGIRNNEGRYVKWGKVIRSDEMNKLTDADLAYLSSIPVVSVVDFRSQQEIAAAPDKLPESAKGHYIYSITPGNLTEIVTSKTLPDSIHMNKLMENMNELLVTDPDAVMQYKKFFVLLQDEEKLPLSFHCTAGKDRTGMGAALFLSALGVDEHTIMDNYLASNTYITDKYASIIKEMPQVQPLLEVRAEYLQAGLDKIKSEYGSMDNFLTNTLGVDLEKMKDMYLY